MFYFCPPFLCAEIHHLKYKKTVQLQPIQLDFYICDLEIRLPQSNSYFARPSQVLSLGVISSAKDAGPCPIPLQTSIDLVHLTDMETADDKA